LLAGVASQAAQEVEVASQAAQEVVVASQASLELEVARAALPEQSKSHNCHKTYDSAHWSCHNFGIYCPTRRAQRGWMAG